ncbi:MAG: chloride channel protein [Bacteroidota bacterium]
MRWFVKFYQWSLIIAIIAVVGGSISAFFLMGLNSVTDWRTAESLWIYLLPPGGIIIGLFYYYFSRGVEGGNNRLIEEMHRPKHYIHWKMIPLVLFGTLATHLFGGSAGREGTAVQMGGALGDQLQLLFKWTRFHRKTLLRMGVAAGFAGVFGTPLAGAIFALEFSRTKRWKPFSMIVVLLTAFLSDFICHSWGTHHTVYSVDQLPEYSVLSFFSLALAALLFGLTAYFFSISKKWSQQLFQHIQVPYLRPMIGGILLLLLYLTFDLTIYMGLGIDHILLGFETERPFYEVFIKLALTALTLGAGFKGGEATPLFFMGAVLGSSLSTIIPLPLSFMAACGFAAVFGAATNTPIASAFIAAELFGFEAFPFYLLCCFVAYLISGNTSVYATQQPLLNKISVQHWKKQKKR